MDLIPKMLGDTPETTPVQALNSRMTCAVCGSTGHSGNSYSETRPKDMNFISNNPSFNNGNRPPHPRSTPNNARKEYKKKTTEPDEKDTESRPGAEEKIAPKTFPYEFYDTMVLSFPPREKKAAAVEQYSKFVEVIKKSYVNIHLLYAMQVSTYVKYLKDILNKKPLPSAKIVHMTKECSVAILNQPP
ncbi:hypothetical protein U9M48_036044 [Paspalum notatum var. saurae]|uniref:Uncharacterized protein n=1 Tax=Paspalum notatum var. saurae TaxID=547442 RepID=A0AAQ3UDA6_PASNO